MTIPFSASVLIVEDNVYDVELLRRVLPAGYRVHFAKDGGEAIEFIFRRGRYTHRPNDLGLVLLDLDLPLLRGDEVLKIVRAHPELQELALVVFSEIESEDLARHCTGLGANGYLTKPVGSDAYGQVVRETIESWLPRPAHS